MARHGSVRAQRRLRALELRAAGYSYAQIAQMLGYRCKAAAWYAVHQAIQSVEREEAKHLLAIELERLTLPNAPYGIKFRQAMYPPCVHWFRLFRRGLGYWG